MTQNTMQYILQKMHQGDITPARKVVDEFSVHNKKHRDELYLICAKIQTLCSKQAIPGGEEISVSGYEKILAWKSLDKEAAVNLAVILMRWGDIARARSLLIELSHKFPDDLYVSINLGSAYLKANQLKEALEIFQHCIKLDPNNAHCYNNMATIMAKLKQDKLAIEYFKKTVSLDPMHKTAYMGLANLLYQYGLKDEAYNMAEAAAKVSPSNPQTYFTIASMLFQDDQLEEAAEMCRIALRVDPEHNTSRQLLAKVLNIKGQLVESQEVISSISKHRNNDPAAFVTKIELSKHALSEADKSHLYKLVDSNTLSDKGLVSAYMALARSSEIEKNYENEIRFLRKANAFNRKSGSYIPGTIQAYVDKIMDRFTPDFMAQQRPSAIRHASPIFIIGPPRSGSTLTEQIISSHPDVTATGESGYFARCLTNQQYPNWLSTVPTSKNITSLTQALGNDYLERVHQHFPDAGSFFTDKSLFNFFHIGLLHLCFPNAKFINCIRHPIDNSIGMFKQIFNEDFLGFTDDFDTIVEFYKAYQAIMAHWDTLLPGVVLHSHYEELVDNFEGEAHKLISYCGLPWDDDCLRFYENKRDVKTASVLQVRQPIYKTAVAKWKRYEPHVQDLIDKLKAAGVKL